MTDERQPRVLVIDDEITHRIIVKDYLEEAGYLVRLASDGKRGLQMVGTVEPDLIILDMLLPSIDGRELCARIKKSPKTAHIPVILVTASREPDVIERGLAAGADDFVTKPIEWAFLADRVRHVLSKAKSAAHDVSKAAQGGEQVPASVVDDEAVARARAEVKSEMMGETARLQAQLAATKLTHSRQLEDVRDRAEADLQAALEELEASYGELDEARERFENERRELHASVRVEQPQSTAGTERHMRALESEHKQRLQACWEIAGLGSLEHLQLLTSLIDTAESGFGHVNGHGSRQEALDCFERAGQLGKSLSASVGSLKLLAQIMSGKTQLTETVVDLNEVVASTADHMCSLGQAQNVTISASLMDEATEVAIDQSHLAYALVTIITHAVASTPAGGQVAISLIPGDDGSVSIDVTDNGAGIPSELVECYRTCLDRPGAMQVLRDRGVDLAMPTASAMVRLNGARFEIHSEQGVGTSVQIVLPVAACQNSRSSNQSGGALAEAS